MLKNPHPKGTKEYKNWNRVVVLSVFIGIILGFVARTIHKKYS